MKLALTTNNVSYSVTAASNHAINADINASVYDNMPNKGDELAAIVDQARSAFNVAKDQASWAAAHTYKLLVEIHHSTDAEEWFKAALATRNEEIKAEIEDQAATYEDPKEVVRWFYSDPNRLKDIESAVLEANVIKYVSELGTVTDKPVTFEELSKLGQ